MDSVQACFGPGDLGDDQKVWKGMYRPPPPHESQALRAHHLRDEEWTLSTPPFRSQRPQGYHNDLGMSADSRTSKKCLDDRVEESAAAPLLPRT